MNKTDKLLSRIKELEGQRDEFASERDKLLLERKTILDIYTEWLINNGYMFESISGGNHVEKFQRALKKVRQKLRSKS